MPKINSSSVKICESSQKVLAQFSPASRPKILNCYPRRSKVFQNFVFPWKMLLFFGRSNSITCFAVLLSITAVIFVAVT